MLQDVPLPRPQRRPWPNPLPTALPTPLAEGQASPPVVIETDRLMLRRPTLADAPSIARLANDRRIAEMTRRLPNPYRLGDAVGFVESLAAGSSETVFLIEHLHTPVGMVGIDWRDADAPELGYWLGCEFWGRGFATEAARAVIDDAFEAYAITHIVASARVANPASRNILEKCGFQWTGVQLHRVESLQSSTPVDCFRLTRSVWSSLKHWTTATKHEG